MSDDTKSRLFNAKSGHYREELGEVGKALWDAHAETTEARCLKAQADYERFQHVRRREAEDAIYGKLRHEMQAPRPDNVAPPAMPTMEEIRAQARDRVTKQHEAHLDRIRADGQAALDKLIDQVAQRNRGRDADR